MSERTSSVKLNHIANQCTTSKMKCHIISFIFPQIGLLFAIKLLTLITNGLKWSKIYQNVIFLFCTFYQYSFISSSLIKMEYLHAIVHPSFLIEKLLQHDVSRIVTPTVIYKTKIRFFFLPNSVPNFSFDSLDLG